jgi:hypothetical protein
LRRGKSQALIGLDQATRYAGGLDLRALYTDIGDNAAKFRVGYSSLVLIFRRIRLKWDDSG